MNVVRELISVSRFVWIKLVHTLVHVMSDMSRQENIHVKVWNSALWLWSLIYCTSDINECQTDNGGCTQTCDNTDGSYQCSCVKGYELADDKHTCVGKDTVKYWWTVWHMYIDRHIYRQNLIISCHFYRY